MVDWRDFDVPPEPKVSLRDEIKPMREQVPVGRLAVPYNRDVDMVFVKKVKRGNPPDDPIHYYVHADGRNNGGYAMSQDIIDQLELHMAEIVLTFEEDTGNVFEHKLSDFSHKVTNGVYGNDEQYAALEADAMYRWEGIGEAFFTNTSFWSKQ